MEDQPKGLIESATPAQPVAGEEDKFQAWIKATPWYGEFKQKYGEEPDLNTPDYNYRAAWKAGVTPVVNKHDNMYHWPSSLPSGEMLKGDEHPTAWMEYFMRKTGGVDPEAVSRPPSPDEMKFFEQNPKVAGYADFNSGKLVLNPNSPLSQKEKAAVAQNEYTRLMMRKLDIAPKFELTPEQVAAFKNYGDEQTIKETITARIISGDPSALNVTRDQVVAAEQISSQIAAARETE
jgi:hypothetical protein